MNRLTETKCSAKLLEIRNHEDLTGFQYFDISASDQVNAKPRLRRQGRALEDVLLDDKALPGAGELGFLVFVTAGAQVNRPSPAGGSSSGTCGHGRTHRGLGIP